MDRPLNSLIDAGQLYKAYDYADANMAWHQERSALPVDTQAQLAQHFSARNEIATTRDSFSIDPGSPLKIAPDELTIVDRLYATPLHQRVDEIQALADNHMFKDAAGLANMNYILHLNRGNGYWDSPLNGSDNKLYNPDISDRFDTPSLHLMRMYKPSLKNVLPQTSLTTINDKLSDLRRL